MFERAYICLYYIVVVVVANSAAAAAKNNSHKKNIIGIGTSQRKDISIYI